MKWKICFTWKGRKFCIPVPVAINWREVVIGPLPDPPPFVLDARLSARVQSNLQRLAAMDVLADGLRGPARKALKAALKKEALAQELPAEAAIVL